MRLLLLFVCLPVALSVGCSASRTETTSPSLAGHDGEGSPSSPPTSPAGGSESDSQSHPIRESFQRVGLFFGLLPFIVRYTFFGGPGL